MLRPGADMEITRYKTRRHLVSLVTVMVVVWRHELGADWTPGNVNGERFVFIQNVFSLIYILQIKGCWDIMALIPPPHRTPPPLPPHRHPPPRPRESRELPSSCRASRRTTWAASWRVSCSIHRTSPSRRTRGVRL